MRTLTRTYRYIVHRIHAANLSLRGKGHGLSPGFVERAIGNNTGFTVPRKVETMRGVLLSNTMLVPVHLFGADKAHGNHLEQVRRIVKRSSVTTRQGEVLFRLSALFKPDLILELGTSVGLGTLYLSTGHPDARVISVEGNRVLADIAEGIFRKQEISNIIVMQCTFEDALHRLSVSELSNALVFVDGDHSYEATLRYFNHLIGRAGENCLMIFHDIHWSEGMHRAWLKIKSDRRIKVSYDLYDMGIVFNSGVWDKKDIVLRY